VRAMSLASRMEQLKDQSGVTRTDWVRTCHSALTSGSPCVPDQRKQELVQMVKLQRLIKGRRRQEGTFALNFLTKQTTITKNVNQALHEIKTHEGENQIRQRAIEIRDDLRLGMQIA
jgi:hypothetical protein